jgi:hypothetical protein
LCSVKDRKASQLQNHCEEYQEKYENDTQELKQKLELSESTKKRFSILKKQKNFD